MSAAPVTEGVVLDTTLGVVESLFQTLAKVLGTTAAALKAARGGETAAAAEALKMLEAIGAATAGKKGGKLAKDLSKKRKGPSSPTAYVLFCKATRASIKQEGDNPSTVMTKLGHMWAGLPDYAKKPYYDQAAKLKADLAAASADADAPAAAAAAAPDTEPEAEPEVEEAPKKHKHKKDKKHKHKRAKVVEVPVVEEDVETETD